jgi:hypothetical protein
MLQQVEKKSSTVPVSGIIERINEKGIKVNGEWWNFSKFSKTNPILKEGDRIEFKSSKNFINEVTNIVPANGSAAASESQPKTETKTSETKETKVEAKSSKDESTRKDPPQKKTEKDYEVLGNCLKDAVYITDDIHEVKFSTTDIVKLALTLFIHRTS